MYISRDLTKCIFVELHCSETKIYDSDILMETLRNNLKKQSIKEIPLNLTESSIYETILKIGRTVLQEYLDGLNDDVDTTEKVNYNGESLPYKGKEEREYVSIFGPVKIRRAYHWKKGCTEGFCPLDNQLNLPEGKFSYALQDIALKLLVSGPYNEALDTIERIFKVRLWSEAVKSMLERASSYVHAFYKGIKNYEETEGPIIAVTMDCKGIPMVPAERSKKAEPKKVRREKGDKRKGLRRDAVVTSHFTFFPEPRTSEEMFKVLMRLHTEEERKEEKAKKKEKKALKQPASREPINKQVHAAMDGKEKAFERLGDQILLRNPTKEKKLIVLIDGASSLETKFKEEMRKRKWVRRVDAYILYIFHATEYLWEGGSALYGEKSPKRQEWVSEKLKEILEGKVGYVIGSMRQILKKDTREELKQSGKKVLEKVITYFENHKHMMKYDEYLQKGYPIGTGVIEGACGCLVKDRTDRSGMKWTHAGVQAILNLRAVEQNNDWDKYFAYYTEMERQRLYKKTSS